MFGSFRNLVSLQHNLRFKLFDIQAHLAMPPSLRVGYTEKHRLHHIELGAPDHYREIGLWNVISGLSVARKKYSEASLAA